MRFAVAVAIGLGAGWLGFVWLVALSAVLLGDLAENAALPPGWSRLWLFTLLFVAVTWLGGLLKRMGHALEERKSLDKPRPPPKVTKAVLQLFLFAATVLGAVWLLRDGSLARERWVVTLASAAAWVVVWSGGVLCAAAAVSLAGSLAPPTRSAARVGLAAVGLVGAGSVAALPAVSSLAQGDPTPYAQAVEVARTHRGSSIGAVPAIASELRTTKPASASARPSRRAFSDCAESFLRPDGKRRAAYVSNERIARRRAPWQTDIEQLLLDAVVATCQEPREEPAAYLTRVVRNALFHERRRPDGEVCALDPQLPAALIDVSVRAQIARCWNLLQQVACQGGDLYIAILHLRASGATWSEVAVVLGKTESAVKMRMDRFLKLLPASIRQQCQ